MKKLNLFANAVLLLILLCTVVSCSNDDIVSINETEVMNEAQLKKQRDLDRIAYVDKIEVNTNLKSNIVAKTTQNFSGVLMNGDDRNSRSLGSFGYYGFSINVSNYSSAYSVEELNFALYGVRSNGTKSVISGWYNDIPPGQSRNVSFSQAQATLLKTQYTSLLVVVENDGWLWQTNIPVYYSITYINN